MDLLDILHESLPVNYYMSKFEQTIKQIQIYGMFRHGWDITNSVLKFSGCPIPLVTEAN